MNYGYTGAIYEFCFNIIHLSKIQKTNHGGKMKNLIMVICLLLVTVGLFAKYEEGDVCDDISWTDSNGLETSIYDQTSQGKAVLIFWGTINSMPSETVAPQLENEWQESYKAGADSPYEGKSYWIATENWETVTFPYSEELYNQIGEFETGFYPTIGIIGKDNIIYYNSFGYSSLILEKLKDAINSFNAIEIVNPIADCTIGFNETIEVDLNDVFSIDTGESFSYEVDEISDPNALSGEISGSILTLTSSDFAANVKVVVKAIAGENSIVDEFFVIIMPANANIILEEGFENGIPSDWIILDEDGDAKSWYITTPENSTPHSGTYCVASASWAGPPLTPDNWLITPKITLESISIFSYFVCAQDASCPADHYGIYISETGVDPDDFKLLFEETMVAKNSSKLKITREPRVSGQYYHRLINIPENYAGKDIYLAIRHFNCTDQFRINFDDISVETTLGVDEAVANPKTVELLGNYPNPFNPNTTISFKLDNATNVKLSVFNVRGELVEELLNNKFNAGIHNLDFNAEKLNSGVYYYRLEAGGVNITKKMLLIK